MHTALIALLSLVVLLPSTAAAKPQCKVKQDECQQARERCIAISEAVRLCPAGKEKRCLRQARAKCTKEIRKCCKRTPLETCCGGGTYGGGGGPTTTIGGGGSTTTTVVTSTTTSTVAQSCTSSTDCDGFACCNVGLGQCCVLGSGSAACNAVGPTPILFGTAGCTSTDGIDFPPTPVQCGPSRPPTCPTEAVTPVGFQCHICGDQTKIMQTLYNSATGVRTPYQ